MTIKEREKQIKLFAALVVALSMIIIMILSNTAEAQTAKRYHAKLQKEYSYENRLKANQAFTLASAKDNLKILKVSSRKKAKHQKHLTKIIKIQNKMRK